MKLQSIPVLSLLAALTMTSCRLDKPDPLPTGTTCTVQLSPKHESGLTESDEPLTMATGAKDLYAIQVYKKGTINEVKYAYGIFDNEDDMQLELSAGTTYRIEICMIEKGTSRIAQDDNGGYHEPFVLSGASGGPGKITNQFTESMMQGLKTLTTGYAYVNQEGAEAAGYNRAPVSRYYGTAEITPTEDTRLTIDLKWVCFGLTVEPTDFTEGRIEVEMEGAPLLTVTPDAPNAVTKQIFTFDHSLSSDDWTADDYSEEVPISITWIKDDGSKVHFRYATDPTTIKRKTNKIFQISCGSSSSDVNMTITKEDPILTDEVETLALP